MPRTIAEHFQQPDKNLNFDFAKQRGADLLSLTPVNLLADTREASSLWMIYGIDGNDRVMRRGADQT